MQNQTNSKMRISLLPRRTILITVIFAIAFAFVEAAVVVYIRQILGIDSGFGYEQLAINKDQIIFSLPGLAFLSSETVSQIITVPQVLKTELFREVATLVMLISVAVLAGKNLRQKAAYFLLAFGAWDIFYYVFLRLLIGWPKTLFDTDIFFLLPIAWVGPVITPVLVSTLIVFTSLVLLNRRN